MKKLLLLVFCAIIAASWNNDDWEAPEWTLKEGTKTLPKSDHPLTKDEAWQLVNLEFFGGSEQNINANVYISTNIVPPAYNLFFWPWTNRFKGTFYRTKFSWGKHLVCCAWQAFIQPNDWIGCKSNLYLWIWWQDYNQKISVFPDAAGTWLPIFQSGQRLMRRAWFRSGPARW